MAAEKLKVLREAIAKRWGTDEAELVGLFN